MIVRTIILIFLCLLNLNSAVFAEKVHPKTNGSISIGQHQQKDFPKMAKINSSQAVKAATARISGQVISVTLEDEGGSLVYAVEIVDAQSLLYELNVDAGNKKILSIEKKGRSHIKNAPVH